MKGVCVRSIEGLEVERSKNICQERKRKGLDAKNATVGGRMKDGKGLDAKNARVVVVGWEMGRD